MILNRHERMKLPVMNNLNEKGEIEIEYKDLRFPDFKGRDREYPPIKPFNFKRFKKLAKDEFDYKFGDPKKAIDCCVLLNQWNLAVELAE